MHEMSIFSLKDGKATNHRSEKMEFTVPEDNNEGNTEIITVLNESVPRHLPGLLSLISFYFRFVIYVINSYQGYK